MVLADLHACPRGFVEAVRRGMKSAVDAFSIRFYSSRDPGRPELAVLRPLSCKVERRVSGKVDVRPGAEIRSDR